MCVSVLMKQCYDLVVVPVENAQACSIPCLERDSHLWVTARTEALRLLEPSPMARAFLMEKAVGNDCEARWARR
jgi:hypothetical protein